MAVPDFQEMMYPILEFMRDRRELRNGEIKDNIPLIFNLSQEDQNVLNINGHQKYRDNAGFAISYLFRAGLLTKPAYALYSISDKGLLVLENDQIKSLKISDLKIEKDSNLTEKEEQERIEAEQKEEEDNVEILAQIFQISDELEKLNNKYNHFNVFDVLRIVHNEIRHSNVLAWLLNPNENHNLHGDVLFNLVKIIVNNDKNNKFDKLKLLLLDLNSFSIRREEHDIDILLVSEKAPQFLIAIENKVDSKEHASTGYKSQLTKYRLYLDEKYPLIKNDDDNRIFLLLSPDGAEPNDEEEKKYWKVIKYQDILNAVTRAVKKNEGNIDRDVEFFINNYIEILGRDIAMNDELKKQCEDIYNKYPKAFDLIFANCERGYAKIYNGIQQAIDEYVKEGKIIPLKTRSFKEFYTETMDNYFPKFEDNISSWKTDHCYHYWFEVRGGNKIVLHFELGLENITSDMQEKQDLLIDSLKKNKKDGSTRYFRLHKYEKIIDDDVEDITAKACSLAKLEIDDMLKWEKEQLSKLM